MPQKKLTHQFGGCLILLQNQPPARPPQLPPLRRRRAVGGTDGPCSLSRTYPHLRCWKRQGANGDHWGWPRDLAPRARCHGRMRWRLRPWGPRGDGPRVPHLRAPYREWLAEDLPVVRCSAPHMPPENCALWGSNLPIALTLVAFEWCWLSSRRRERERPIRSLGGNPLKGQHVTSSIGHSIINLFYLSQEWNENRRNNNRI